MELRTRFGFRRPLFLQTVDASPWLYGSLPGDFLKLREDKSTKISRYGEYWVHGVLLISSPLFPNTEEVQ